MTSNQLIQTPGEGSPTPTKSPAAKVRPSSLKRAFLTILKAVELGYRVEGLAAALRERAERTKVTEEQDSAARDREVWRQEQFDALDEIDAEIPKVMRLIEEARIVPGIKRRRKTMRPLNARLNKLGDDRLAILHALAQREDEERRQARITELAQLEALRGGQVLIEEVVVETPVVEDWRGQKVQVWRNGERLKVREHLVRPVVTSRDGLETLATMHLTIDGRVRMNRDGTPMLPAISEVCRAAGMRFRELYELCDPEGVLHAVNPEDMGRGKPPRDTFSSRVVAAIQDRAEFSGVVRRLEARVREELGEEGVYVLIEVAAKGNTIRSIAPGRRRAIRLTFALREALGILAEAFGLM